MSEVFGALGPLGKLTLLTPFLLALALPWWMPSLPARRRLDLFLCLSLLPVVTGGLATWQGVANARAALDAIGPSVGIPADAVRAELLVPLFAGFFASVLFLGIGFCGELARASAAGRRLHPVLFAGALAVVEVLALVGLGVGLFAPPIGPTLAPAALGLLALTRLVLLLILAHGMWAVVGPRFARTSPGRAVALMFVPLFNLYWFFQVFAGWGRDFDRMNRDRRPDSEHVSGAGLDALVTLVLLAPGFEGAAWRVHELVSASTAPASAPAAMALFAAIALLVAISRAASVLFAWRVCSAVAAVEPSVASTAVAGVPVRSLAAAALAVSLAAAGAVGVATIDWEFDPPPPRVGSGFDQAPTASVPPVLPPPPPAARKPLRTEEDDPLPAGIADRVPGEVVGGIVGDLPGTNTGKAPRHRGPEQPIRIGAGMQAPRLLHRESPEYPPLAIQAHLSALVILEAHVDSRGLVRDVKVLRGAPLFDQAAITALRAWRYEPLLVDGKPRAFVLTVTMNFKLATKQ